ncbi:conserved hypothetical protein [Nitrobacter hamburgensis X14]|uniref:Uncharacterized protein n=2 Tax=Nitrobacter hamburgensis TaxID=912 RepID=Q1QI18_NITHX|nr:conserved hypothetical protein [Nitrobacter hamburgensis X14]
MSSSAESPELAPEQELSAPPPDDIKLEAPKLEIPRIEPKVEAEAPKAEAPRIESEVEAEAPKVEAPRVESKVEADAPKAEAPRIEPKVEAEAPKADALRETGKIMIVAPSRDQSWDRATIDQGPAAASGAQASSRFGKRRLAAIAAVAVLAAIAGAIGGSLATSGLGHGVAGEQSSAMASRTQAMEATITRLESEVATLKTGIDRSAKGEAGQFAKVNDRLDKVEKAHAESAAKLTKLNETLDRQRVSSSASVAAPAAAATNVTGSIPTVATPVPLPAAKPAIARLPAVEGWVLRDVANGGALIEGRGGIYEVYAGDPVPGLGRVDAIRKQDGRWVVVTSRGLVVSR